MSKDTRIERLPPQNIEAEEAVLGGLLIDSDAIIRVSTVLKPEDFYREKSTCPLAHRQGRKWSA